VLTLTLDSSAAVATAVVADDAVVLAVHSERGSTLSLLHQMVRAALDDSGRSFRDLDQLAVVRGPGSWTGLHVCVTTAKTLAQVAGKPLVGMSMLDCLARTAAPSTGTVCALVDAKHDAFYSSVHDVTGDELVPLVESRRRSAADLAKVLTEVGGPISVVGMIPPERVLELEAASAVDVTVLPFTYPTPEAFAAVALSMRDSALHGDARYALTPDYMQDDFTISSRK
jgi:tRNA threonylcarbamoyladenosine biosynthesis protein TsaB